VTPIACHSLASETDKIDLGIPLPTPLADRAHGVEAAISRLKGHDVERVGAVGSMQKTMLLAWLMAAFSI
jgi:hypothetical protein